MSIDLSVSVTSASSTNASKDTTSLATGWILTKLERNDPYMAFFDNCSHWFSQLHSYRSNELKIYIGYLNENLILFSEMSRPRGLIFGM